ncbi:ATP-grasp domain-containing protein [Kitasatospora sp. NPDC059571]|uniref:ATP-grasp domain-containing protein n=1 Tax=Kitasatospora sp. NPDC059571 TaxID=3346871 RepID=UPI0036AF9204
MKLLALEARQNGTYYHSRYRQVEEFGGDLHVLNGIGEPDYWAPGRYRIAGSQHIDDLVAAARSWHEEERFDGILTFSESAVVAVAAVAEALGLPGIGLEAARTSRNKLLMRRAHAAGGAPHPDFRFVPDLAAALRAGEDLGYPVILKPTLGAASNYVFRIDSADDMARRFPQAEAGLAGMTWSAMEVRGVDLGPHGLLVESFLNGREMQIEAAVWDGEVFLGSVVDRITVEGGTFDDDVHRAPTSLGTDEVEQVRLAVAAGIRAQGIRRGVVHAEVRFHDGRPHLLEIAARPGGGDLDSFARVTAGHCPIRALMAAARGERPALRPFTPTGVHIAGMVLLCAAGRIEEIELPETAGEPGKEFFVKITARPGDLIRRPPEGNNILGFLGCADSSFEEAMRRATEFADNVRVRVGR